MENILDKYINEIINGDSLELIKELPDNSINEFTLKRSFKSKYNLFYLIEIVILYVFIT